MWVGVKTNAPQQPAKKKPTPGGRVSFSDHQCMVWHICSMCSMAGTASRLASPVPMENQHLSPATSFHTTLTMPYFVQTVARRGRSHRFRWTERTRG